MGERGEGGRKERKERGREGEEGGEEGGGEGVWVHGYPGGGVYGCKGSRRVRV